MNFSYFDYNQLLETITGQGYRIASFHDYGQQEKACILRHDVDLSISKAVELAEFEANRAVPVKSTFFILLRSDFYNPATLSNVLRLQRILGLGHEIGLHFDEKSYSDGCENGIIERVQSEIETLQKILERPVRTVSMHRPSAKTLESNYRFDNALNTYSSVFFREFKYLSDSRMNWREDPIAAVKSNQYPRLQIVTHPVWYHHQTATAKQTLRNFVVQALEDRYCALEQNIRDLDEIIKREDIHEHQTV